MNPESRCQQASAAPSTDPARLGEEAERREGEFASNDCSTVPRSSDSESAEGEDSRAGSDEAISSRRRRHASDMEDLLHLQLKQRQGLSISRKPLATVRYFMLAVLDQLRSVGIFVLGSWVLFGACVTVLCTVSGMVALDFPSVTVAHAFLSYLSFGFWWLALGILSSIGLGTGLQTFLLYLGPHIARFTLKATACGRTDIKAAPYDTAVWGTSDTWSSRACTEFGTPQYPHFPGEHGGYFAVPLLHLVLSVLPEAMLWGAGTAIGELPPFLVARAARLSGERAKALDELMEGEKTEGGEEGEEYRLLRRSKVGQGQRPGGEGVQGRADPLAGADEDGVEGGWLEKQFRRAKVWLFAQGSEFSFFTIVVLAAIPNPLFDLAGLTCGHFLVPAWKFFSATIIGKSFFKAPSQALVVAMLFNAHSIELLEDALDSMSREQVPLVGRKFLPWLTTALDSFRVRMTEGQTVSQMRSRGFSVSMLWTSFVVLMFLAFLCSIMTSTARAYLLHQQQQELLRLQQQMKLRQLAGQQETGKGEEEKYQDVGGQHREMERELLTAKNGTES